MSGDYMLITTDGYTISTETYSSKEAAVAAMMADYNDKNHDITDEELHEQSYVDDVSGEGMLYTGENVFVWKTVRI